MYSKLTIEPFLIILTSLPPGIYSTITHTWNVKGFAKKTLKTEHDDPTPRFSFKAIERSSSAAAMNEVRGALLFSPK
jgi:hypothetical protein